MIYNNSIKQNVRNLIASDNVKEALIYLIKNTSDSEPILNNLALLNARYIALKKEQISGTIKEDDASIKINNIRDSILKILDTPSTNKLESSKQSPSKKNKKSIRNLFVVIAVLIFMYLGIILSNTFSVMLQNKYNNEIVSTIPIFLFLIAFVTFIFFMPSKK